MLKSKGEKTQNACNFYIFRMAGLSNFIYLLKLASYQSSVHRQFAQRPTARPCLFRLPSSLTYFLAS